MRQHLHSSLSFPTGGLRSKGTWIQACNQCFISKRFLLRTVGSKLKWTNPNLLLGSPAVTLVGEYILAVCCIFRNHTSAWWEADFIVIVLGRLEATLRDSIQFVLRFFSPRWRSKTFQIAEHRAMHTLFFLTEFPLSHLTSIPSDSSLLVCIFTLIVFMNTVHRESASC